MAPRMKQLGFTTKIGTQHSLMIEMAKQGLTKG